MNHTPAYCRPGGEEPEPQLNQAAVEASSLGDIDTVNSCRHAVSVFDFCAESVCPFTNKNSHFSRMIPLDVYCPSAAI